MIFFILITQIIKYNLKINNKNNLEKEELHPRIKNWRADQVTLSAITLGINMHNTLLNCV
jgi:hypothetical protein